jgi:hypothetical protein
VKNLEVRGQRYEDQERSENLTIRLNLFQHRDPKNRCALKSKNPLVAAKSRPWSFVPNHEPVLWEERFFDAARAGCSFLVENSVMTENEVRS